MVRDYLVGAGAGGEPKPIAPTWNRFAARWTPRSNLTAIRTTPNKSRHFLALRSELEGYWDILAPVFEWNTEQRSRQGYLFLRDEVFPRRQTMLTMADRIASLNEQAVDRRSNAQVAELLAGFQDRLGITLLAALALGLGMAAFSVHRIFKLEARERARFEEVAGARTQLDGSFPPAWCRPRETETPGIVT